MQPLRETYLRNIGLALATRIALLATQAYALDIAPPDNNVWLLDHAELVSEADATRIADICAALDSELSRPMYVLSIPAMADYDASSANIERFAQRLYEEWAEHPGFPSASTWRNGILLLISKEDRKARIELGANWSGRLDTKCQRIMDHAIIPAFKRGDFSGGILAGVTALDQMARDDAAPAAAPATVSTPDAPAQSQPVTIPVETRPAPSRPQHYPSPAHQVTYAHARSAGGGMQPGAFFVLFIILMIVVGFTNKLLGGSSGNNASYKNRRRRNNNDWYRGQDHGFFFHDHHSHGISSHHDHGGASFGSSGGGHSHSGGGGGASGSW